jgi:hypothetical protein
MTSSLPAGARAHNSAPAPAPQTPALVAAAPGLTGEGGAP